MTRKLVFFDTTLRDGEQAPGNTMNPDQKLSIALSLEKMGVDIIEAGFPASSKDDFHACSIIADSIKNSIVCGFARCNDNDIDAVYQSLKNAKKSAIHIFLPVSDLHINKKMRLTTDEVLNLADITLKKVCKMFDIVYFGLEDSTRADRNFLFKMITLISKHNVDCINIGDTVGGSQPDEIFDLIKHLKESFPKQNFGIHCHNDLGLATANTLAAIKAGIDQVQVTVNGIGERSGNTSLEEVVANIITRPDFYDVKLNIKSELTKEISDLLYKTLNRFPSYEKSIVGVNSFRHEAGIHIDGLHKDINTYQFIDPKRFGYEIKIVKGKHSGNN